MSEGSFGKEEGSATQTNRVDIPDFLKPLIGQGTSIAGSTLARLREMAQFGDDLVAGFTPDQRAAFEQIRELSGNVPGQNVLSAAAGGEGLSFLPETVRGGLSSFGGVGFLPDFTRSTLTAGGGIPATATDALGNAINAEAIPGAARGALTAAASGGFAPDVDALRRTANGDFLFGGPGSEAAIEAAVRAAQPGILSTFGGAGVGGGTGALSQAAIGRAATDAFARQFAQERQNQLGAAGTLANLDLAGNAQRLGAAETLAGLGLQGNAQRIGAADALGRLGLAGRGQDIQSAGLLGDFAAGAEGRELQGLLSLSGLSDAERSRQLDAASLLPGLAFGGAESLLDIGGLQQQNRQQRLSAPFDLQMKLLGSILGIPGAFSPLFGGTQAGQSEASGFSLGFS